jgi:hypothetical protein
LRAAGAVGLAFTLCGIASGGMKKGRLGGVDRGGELVGMIPLAGMVMRERSCGKLIGSYTNMN